MSWCQEARVPGVESLLTQGLRAGAQPLTAWHVEVAIEGENHLPPPGPVVLACRYYHHSGVPRVRSGAGWLQPRMVGGWTSRLAQIDILRGCRSAATISSQPL